jgi:hypothetical protein
MKACASREPDVLRHAQGVIVCLALVTSFGDFLDSSESDCKMVAIVPTAKNDQWSTLTCHTFEKFHKRERT